MKMKQYEAKKSKGMANFGFSVFCVWVKELNSLLNKRQVN